MTATATRPAASPSDGELSHRQILTILSGLVMGMFLAALDQNIVSTAIKTIGNDLHDLKAQAWVTTAFLITTTIAAPLFGKLSDIYGRKRLFMLSIVIFTIGSALCGLATSMYELAGFRAFQGIGAGGIMPLAMAVIGDIIPPRERARYQGYMMAVFASASVLGPVLGGLLSGASDFLGVAGWRWIFYINVPLAAAALIVVARVLRLDHARRERRIDWWGSVMLAVGLVPLLVVAEQGQSWGWASVASFTCYVLGAVGLALFVVIQHRMGDDALLPLRLFRSPTFSVASGQVTIIGMAMFGGLSVIPLYLQIVKGASPTKSGLLLLPMVAGLMLASLAAGRIVARTGRYKVFPVVGSVLMVIGMGLFITLRADTALWTTDIYMTIFGIGLGMNMQSLVLAMQNAVPAKDMGVASAASFTAYLLSAAGLIVFVWIQHRMGDDALLPLRLFRSPTFSVASGQVTIIGMAMFGGLAVIPLYLQIVKGASPTRSGLLLLPMVAGLMLASLGSGRLIARTGRYKVFPVVGSVLMVIGMGLLVTVGADTPLGPTDIYMTIFGLGLGLNMQSLVLAMQNAVPAKDMGVASASSSFFRSVGGTLGTAIFLSILFSEAGTKIGQQYAKAATDPAYLAAAKANPAQVTSLQQHLSGGLDDTSFLNGLAKPLVHPFFVGFSSAGDVVFAVTAILLLAAVVLSACLKEVPLRRVSGNQARAAAEASAGDSAVVADHDAGAEPAGAVRAPGAGDAVSDATRTLVRNKGLTIEEET